MQMGAFVFSLGENEESELLGASLEVITHHEGSDAAVHRVIRVIREVQFEIGQLNIVEALDIIRAQFVFHFEDEYM